MKLNEAISIRVVELLALNDLSQSRLASYARLTPATVGDIIKSKHKSPTVSTIKKICEAFDISLAEFFAAAVFEECEVEND